MAWCPQCDEEFPEGPACPRCRSPLVELGAVSPDVDLPQVGDLPRLKVPRRLRRAFDNLDRRPGPPRPLFAFTMAFVLFAGGFVVGRMGAVVPDQPVIRQRVEAFPGEASGSVEFVGWTPGTMREPGLVRLDLASGQIDVVSRFTWPFAAPPTGRERTRVLADQRSVAVVLSDGERRSFVGAFPASRPLPVWVDGVDAAWDRSGELLVLEREGEMKGWSFEAGPSSEPVPGRWTAVHQTEGGAVLEGIHDNGRHLWRMTDDGPRRTIALPEGGRLLAVDAGAGRALVETGGRLGVWDGEFTVDIRGVDGFEATSAAFSRDADKLAVTMHERGGADRPSRVVAIVDRMGNAALKPFPTRSSTSGCSPTPSWEPSDRWVFVSPGDGWLYGVEVMGGRVHTVNARSVGCGIAWLS